MFVRRRWQAKQLWLFALLLAADLHYTSSFGVVGQWTKDVASKWPWARNPITYQEQFVAGILVARWSGGLTCKLNCRARPALFSW